MPKNAKLLIDDETDLALIQAVSIPSKEELAHVAPLYYEPIYALARKDSGIESIQQFKDCHVLLGPPGSGSRACIELLIKTLPNTLGNITISSEPWQVLLSENSPSAAMLCLGQASPFLDKLRNCLLHFWGRGLVLYKFLHLNFLLCLAGLDGFCNHFFNVFLTK